MKCIAIDHSFIIVALAAFVSGGVNLRIAHGEIDAKVKQLIDNGSYAEAEKLLAPQAGNPAAPVTSEAAVQRMMEFKGRR